MSGYYFGVGAKRVLNLLVYRCTLERYFSEQKADGDAYVRAVGLDPQSKSPAEARAVSNIRQHWFEKQGGPWELNEAVGMIELCAAPHKIGGILYYINRRITKNMLVKRFFETKMLEFNVWPEDHSERIYSTLRKSLIDAIAERHS